MRGKRFLNPGDLYFGDQQLVETLLGSCVAITLWFPRARKGGICHFLLPGRQRVPEHARNLDGRYGNEAWIWLKQQARIHGLKPAEAEVKLFGGARSLTTPNRRLSSDVGGQNVRFAERLVDEAGLRVIGRDLGGEGCRFVRFDPASGTAWVRRGAALNIQAAKEAQR
ncbi:chemotaxis protein CheD [Pseudomonas schmalbachii]|uniref:Probable chemoreceptor glutamine deamidase CheD n=1 Tax=Pseudomonas schmalbachii TaxID=2816993 RepID=A0ABS3TM91_9PSED|nr:chemotaxis protein CheD [Pseudomonas schmalbachii]MBO3274779.1 chemotaxis protein CheD [Pseudomonas schmalbachii]